MKQNDSERLAFLQETARILSSEMKVPIATAKSVIQLFDQGSTIPFIARYRKELTGGMEETSLLRFQERWQQLLELSARKQFILKTIENNGMLSGELRQQIINCFDPAFLEDLYLPYKPKRKTRATAAKELGLEPLAEILFRQSNGSVESIAAQYLSGDVEAALQGARDIMAEWISEHAQSRSAMRQLFIRNAVITCKLIKGKEDVGKKYKDYFNHVERLNKAPSHRVLAIWRAEAEGVIKVHIEPEVEDALSLLGKYHIRASNPAAAQVQIALADSYKRLLQPAMDTEMRQIYKAKADEIAIRVFQDNLRPLLLDPPLGQKFVMGIDPGFRTGCKVACLNALGTLLEYTTIYPHTSKADSSAKTIIHLTGKYNIEAIAIGNGTGGKETLDYIKKLGLSSSIDIFLVSEAGASIYSASEIAREEFPDLDLTYRSAVSIGRRLMDPLAELIKIDPRSIGVGQYQHEVHQGKLKEALDQTVISCVNSIGVQVNTASIPLLSYIAGLGPSLAANIVQYREQHGPFKSRDSLKKVPRLGDKAFEQCAGFLRIRESSNPLDNTGVHPERYALVMKMAHDLNVPLPKLLANRDLTTKIPVASYVDEQVGIPTLTDIMKELANPGLDPRGSAKVFHFNEGINTIEDVEIGLELRGKVTNLTQFGAFIDIGVKQDGMVHISQMSDRFISNPAEVLTLGQEVMVKVIGVEIDRSRIQLSLKGLRQYQR